MISCNQAIKVGVSFSALLPQKSYSGVIRRPFAFFPNLGVVLIAESQENKIGIYEANTLDFQCWMLHPDVTKGTRFDGPNKFLILNDGTVFLQEENKLNILDLNFVPRQKPVIGTFIKLIEGDLGSVWTQEKNTLTYQKLELYGNLYSWKTDTSASL